MITATLVEPSPSQRSLPPMDGSPAFGVGVPSLLSDREHELFDAVSPDHSEDADDQVGSKSEGEQVEGGEEAKGGEDIPAAQPSPVKPDAPGTYDNTCSQPPGCSEPAPGCSDPALSDCPKVKAATQSGDAHKAPG
eukprot:971104-Alexandrium_andersonii.AAC.1